MTTKLLQQKKAHTVQAHLDAWELVRGMWKSRKPDALKYQKNIRQEKSRV